MKISTRDMVFKAIAQANCAIGVADIKAATGLNADQIRGQLRHLIEAGRVEKTGGYKRMYQIPDQPTVRSSIPPEKVDSFRALILGHLRYRSLNPDQIAVMCGYRKPDKAIKRFIQEMAQDGLIQIETRYYGKDPVTRIRAAQQQEVAS